VFNFKQTVAEVHLAAAVVVVVAAAATPKPPHLQTIIASFLSHECFGVF
jgi:hypothetical protein